ncbi:MAG: hypothetical protein U5L96_00380 [Owenweeksia sp.]|nr:hypothetical protein [Owenweeksia sp.]
MVFLTISLHGSQTRNQEDPHETYYRYFEQLAARDEKNLFSLGIINKGKDVDNAFEYATQYMFKNAFGHEILNQEGADHCDGVHFLFKWRTFYVGQQKPDARQLLIPSLTNTSPNLNATSRMHGTDTASKYGAF